jgi:hypothetical protein
MSRRGAALLRRAGGRHAGRPTGGFPVVVWRWPTALGPAELVGGNGLHLAEPARRARPFGAET